MDAEQLELQPQPQRPVTPWPVQMGPEVSEHDLARFMDRLRGQGWRTAADLGALHERDKRKLRAISRASEGKIISGPLGYRLTAEVSAEEFTKCRARLQHFVDDLNEHIGELDAVWFEIENRKLPL